MFHHHSSSLPIFLRTRLTSSSAAPISQPSRIIAYPGAARKTGRSRSSVRSLPVTHPFLPSLSYSNVLDSAAMNDHFTQLVLRATGATSIGRTEQIQSLWSNYGQIIRCQLRGASISTVVIKHVHWPDQNHHPRGWNTDRSHERKVRSYQVETAFYANWASRCTSGCRIPESYALEEHGEEATMAVIP